jgi:hypothetical protein
MTLEQKTKVIKRVMMDDSFARTVVRAVTDRRLEIDDTCRPSLRASLSPNGLRNLVFRLSSGSRPAGGAHFRAGNMVGCC